MRFLKINAIILDILYIFVAFLFCYLTVVV